MADIRIDARHAFLTIAKALDYVGVDDVNHAHRVAYMAYECAKRLGWPQAEQERVFYAGLIHDCGVISTQEHMRILSNLAPQDADAHCIRGAEALQQTSLLASFSTIVRYHHTPWRQLKALDISEQDKRQTALIHIADRVDFLRARYIDERHPEIITLHEGIIAENIRHHVEDLFEPEMADAMVQCINTDGFWYLMDHDRIERMATEFESYTPFNTMLSIHEVTELARFLAHIVDAKSPFTFQHSDKVALVAKALAKDAKLSDMDADQLYVAGLMHDVGKLRTPDEILHSPGKLSDQERSIIKRHTVDTMMTLEGLFPNSKIGEWASNHHERLNGTGYPYSLAEDELDTPSRIIAVADVFQALSQKRPYKGRMSIEEVMQILDKMVAAHELDSEIVELLRTRQTEYYAIAIAETH